MLKKFSVSNFKNFESKTTFDLSNPCNYEFNNEVIDNNTVTKGLIYGINGSGKSNLALAIFDIIIHLTDKNRDMTKYNFYYLNLNSKKKYAEFEYEFMFDGNKVLYKYQKYGPVNLKMEQLFINDAEVISFDYDTFDGFTTLKGAENLNLNIPNPISRVKFLKSNALLENNEINATFYKFCDFVDHMLMFYSLDGNSYQGLTIGSETITNGIIRRNKVKEFEEFLHKYKLDYNINVMNVTGAPDLYCHFKNGNAHFFSIASTGTKSLSLLFYWYMVMQEASFIFIEDFDAFYHFELAKSVVELVKELKGKQVFFSTYNTDLLTNDLLRPDCYFIIENNKINSLNKLTNKELRKAHNIQKMYKAGFFNS